MQREFSFEPGPTKEVNTPTRAEILAWDQGTRNQRYRELVGQFPFADMTPEQVADGILSPEKEIAEVLRRNRDDDGEENLKNYRR